MLIAKVIQIVIDADNCIFKGCAVAGVQIVFLADSLQDEKAFPKGNELCVVHNVVCLMVCGSRCKVVSLAGTKGLKECGGENQPIGNSSIAVQSVLPFVKAHICIKVESREVLARAGERACVHRWAFLSVSTKLSPQFSLGGDCITFHK